MDHFVSVTFIDQAPGKYHGKQVWMNIWEMRSRGSLPKARTTNLRHGGLTKTIQGWTSEVC